MLNQPTSPLEQWNFHYFEKSSGQCYKSSDQNNLTKNMMMEIFQRDRNSEISRKKKNIKNKHEKR